MKTHQKLVAALAKSGDIISEEMTGNDAHILHMAVGICGEAGELIDAIKKKVIYRKQLDRGNVIEELGDLEFYMEGLRQGLGINREECLAHNISKLSKRYEKMTYSDGAAQERADKQGAGVAPTAQQRDNPPNESPPYNAVEDARREIAEDMPKLKAGEPPPVDKISRLIEVADALEQALPRHTWAFCVFLRFFLSDAAVSMPPRY
jgi:NTP pyrophosphatase (non-canonical NTP hydrolase)